MAEDLNLTKGLKREETYIELIPQIEALTASETDLIANLANITAALKEAFGFLWVGFYIVKGNELVLGPFQGPVACTRIQKGKGVCGKAWKDNKTIIDNGITIMRNIEKMFNESFCCFFFGFSCSS